MKIFLALLLFTTSAIACPNVQKIKTGTSSPCDGWLVSEPKMQELAKTTDELELSKKLILAQEHLRTLDVAEIEFYKQKTKEANKKLEREELKRTFQTVGAFVLGVVVTGFAAKAAIEAAR